MKTYSPQDRRPAQGNLCCQHTFTNAACPEEGERCAPAEEKIIQRRANTPGLVFKQIKLTRSQFHFHFAAGESVSKVFQRFDGGSPESTFNSQKNVNSKGLVDKSLSHTENTPIMQCKQSSHWRSLICVLNSISTWPTVSVCFMYLAPGHMTPPVFTKLPPY